MAEFSCRARQGDCHFNWRENRIRSDLLDDARRESNCCDLVFRSLIHTEQVEEKRTPLQLSMDELAKKLSILSFGIIGVICLIGVIQKRHWLEMFTIGGM